MSKITKITSVIIALFILSASLVGCSDPEPADEGEMLAAAESLLENAVEVNRIFFWEGLPQEEVTEEDGIDMGDAEYVPLLDQNKYLSEEYLMDKAYAVYTEAYCENIRQIGFEGVKVSNNDALYARYVVDLGVMKINRNLAENGLPERIPDVDSIKTVEITHDSAIISVSFESDGKSEKQEVSLKLEDGEWRLDTPTY